MLPATKSINVELQKITLPWRPLLSYHSDAATHDRDMIGASYHRQATQLRWSDDLFDTIIVVSSQGYAEEEHPLMHHQNLLLPTCIVSSIYDCYGAGIILSTRYICTAAMGILCWAIWIRLFTPSIHKICMKNMSFTTHPHEHYFASQLPTTYWTTPDDRHNNKHDICAALAHWCTSVVDQYQ
jgi:hypothetical protein